MSRAIEPQAPLQVGYPSVPEWAMGRRRFLTVTGSATAALVAPVDRAKARSRRSRRPKPKRKKVTIRLGWGVTLRGGNYRINKLTVLTADRSLARFLSDTKQRKHLRKRVRKVLLAHTCASLINGKKLARLEARVGQALRKLYRERVRRRTRTPDVILFVGVPRLACAGSCPAPAPPYCNPPPPPRRPSRRRRRP